MKITRLLEIIILLLNQKTITARELSERFNVSIRTIYRDIDVLSSAGVPVYMSRGSGGGISLLENYTLNKTLLSESEIDGLTLALKTMSATRYPEIDAVLEKISVLFKIRNDDDWIELNFADWSSNPNERNKFDNIRDAIIKKRVVNFDYFNAKGEKSNRFAEPEKLLYSVTTWYLVAYCLKRNAHRIFRLSRIKNVRVTDETFAKREISHKEKQEILDNQTQDTALKLRFSEKVLSRLYDAFDERLIGKNADGSIDVSITMPEDEWLYSYILSFGNYVEVLAPEHIREIIRSRMRETLEMYEGKTD